MSLQTCKIPFILTTVFVVFINIYKSKAQVTKTLEAVLVKKTVMEIALHGTNLVTINKRELEQNAVNNLATVLMQNTTLQIRATAPGMVATISSRGSNAGHVAVLWQNLNLNAVTNGLTDATMLPANAFSKVQVVQNGFSSFAGGGAMGACVILKNEAEKENYLEVGLGNASFARRNIYSKLNLSKNNFNSNLIISHNRALNNFEFYNTSVKDAPRQEVKHGAYAQDNLLANCIYETKTKMNWEFIYGYKIMNVQFRLRLLKIQVLVISTMQMQK